MVAPNPTCLQSQGMGRLLHFPLFNVSTFHRSITHREMWTKNKVTTGVGGRPERNHAPDSDSFSNTRKPLLAQEWRTQLSNFFEVPAPHSDASPWDLKPAAYMGVLTPGKPGLLSPGETIVKHLPTNRCLPPS